MRWHLDLHSGLWVWHANPFDRVYCWGLFTEEQILMRASAEKMDCVSDGFVIRQHDKAFRVSWDRVNQAEVGYWNVYEPRETMVPDRNVLPGVLPGKTLDELFAEDPD